MQVARPARQSDSHDASCGAEFPGGLQPDAGYHVETGLYRGRACLFELGHAPETRNRSMDAVCAPCRRTNAYTKECGKFAEPTCPRADEKHILSGR